MADAGAVGEEEEGPEVQQSTETAQVVTPEAEASCIASLPNPELGANPELGGPGALAAEGGIGGEQDPGAVQQAGAVEQDAQLGVPLATAVEPQGVPTRLPPGLVESAVDPGQNPLPEFQAPPGLALPEDAPADPTLAVAPPAAQETAPDSHDIEDPSIVFPPQAGQPGGAAAATEDPSGPDPCVAEASPACVLGSEGQDQPDVAEFPPDDPPPGLPRAPVPQEEPPPPPQTQDSAQLQVLGTGMGRGLGVDMDTDMDMDLDTSVGMLPLGMQPQQPLRTFDERWEEDSDDNGPACGAACDVQPPSRGDEQDEGVSLPRPLELEDEENQWEHLAETLPEVEPMSSQDQDDDTPEKPALQLPPRFVGEIKKIGQEYGFISCEEVYEAFGRDTYVKRLDLPDVSLWKAQQPVSFCVGLSEKGHPQARHVETDTSKFPERTCSHPDHFRPPTPPRSPRPEPDVTPSSSLGQSTPNRSAQPKGEAWADVIDEMEQLEDEGEEGEEQPPGPDGRRPPRQRRRRRPDRDRDRDREAHRPLSRRQDSLPLRPLRALPLYDMSSRRRDDRTPSPSHSHSPRRLERGESDWRGGRTSMRAASAQPLPRQEAPERPVDREVVEAGAAGSTVGTVPLAQANSWMPALWSNADVVRALCLRRSREFLLLVEGELQKLAAAPRGAVLCLPPLAPFYRSLLRALCARFGMKDTGSAKGHRRPVTVACGPYRRWPLPLSALVPGSWAGRNLEDWAHRPPPPRLAPCPGLRIHAACDLSAYAPDSPGTETDGDQGGGSLVLPSGSWQFMERPEDQVGVQGGVVLTLTLACSQAAGGVGVALCGNRAAAWDQLEQILSGRSSRQPRTVGEDVYTVLFKPCPMGGNWSVRFGHAEQVGDGLQSAGVPLWKRDNCITFWLATHTSPDGRACVDVGLDRFPWCRLFGVRLQRPGFSHVALAALTPMRGTTLSGCRVEWGLCNDWASRDHIVHLSWPDGATTAPPTPKSDGLLAVVGGLAVCKSPSAARSLCSVAVSQGWEVRCLGTFPIDSFGARSRIGAGTSAADLVRQRMDMAGALGPEVALQLGLVEWAKRLGLEEYEERMGEAEEGEDDFGGHELSAAAASFIPHEGAKGQNSFLSADSPEFTPGTGSGLSATAPTFTPGGFPVQGYDDEGHLYNYPPYEDGSWPAGCSGDYGLYPGDARSQLSSSAAVFTPSGTRVPKGHGGKGKRLRAGASEFRPQGLEDGAEEKGTGKGSPPWEPPPAPDRPPSLKVRPPAYSDIRLKQQSEDSSLDALTIKAQRPPPGHSPKIPREPTSARGPTGWREGWRRGGWEPREEESEDDGDEEEDEEVYWTRGKGGGGGSSSHTYTGRTRDKWEDRDEHEAGRWRDGWRDDKWRDSSRRWRQGDWDDGRWERKEWDRGGDWNRRSWKADRWRQEDWREDGRRPPTRERRQPEERSGRPPVRRRQEESSESSSTESSEDSDSEDVQIRPMSRGGAPPRTSAPAPTAVLQHPKADAASSEGEAEEEEVPRPVRQLPKANLVDKAAFHRFALGHLLGSRRSARTRRDDGAAEVPEGETQAGEEEADEQEEPPKPHVGTKHADESGSDGQGEVLEREPEGAAANPERQAEDPECTDDRHEGATGHPECTAEGPE